MDLLVILTLSRPTETGVHQATITRTVTAEPGSTRAGLLRWALAQAPEGSQAEANILFFSAEPNSIANIAGGAR